MYMQYSPSNSMPPATTHLSSRTSPHDKKPPHRRYDSGELDVFQATKYFSGAIDGMIAFVGQETKMGAEYSSDAGLIYKRSSCCVVEQTQKLPAADHNINHHHHHQKKKSSLVVVKDNKVVHSRKRGGSTEGAASSPAARLASFFNSFFNHNTRTNTTSSISTSSAASKTARRLFKSATTRSLKDVQAAGGGASGDQYQRKRRSSTGDFRSSRSSDYSYASRSRSRSRSTTSTTTPPPIPGLDYDGCYKEASRYPLTITVKSQQQQPKSAVNVKSQSSWQDKRMIIQVDVAPPPPPPPPPLAEKDYNNKNNREVIDHKQIPAENSCCRSDEMTTSSKVAQHDGDGDGDEFTNNNNNPINNASGSSCSYDGESDASSDLFELNTIDLPRRDGRNPCLPLLSS